MALGMHLGTSHDAAYAAGLAVAAIAALACVVAGRRRRDQSALVLSIAVSLLATHNTSGELADRVSKFETSMGHILESHKRLKDSLLKLEKLEAQFAVLPPGALPEVKEED